jgi:hypothetical protein
MTKSRKIDIKNEQKTRILQGEDNEIITHKQKISYYKWFYAKKIHCRQFMLQISLGGSCNFILFILKHLI